jgi:hypothetical protein
MGRNEYDVAVLNRMVQPLPRSRSRFYTGHYEFNHSKLPRGRGSWAFEPSHIRGEIFRAPSNTLYSDAKKLAAAHFAATGIFDITTCS